MSKRISAELAAQVATHRKISGLSYEKLGRLYGISTMAAHRAVKGLNGKPEKPPKPLIERLMARTNRSSGLGPDGDCWEWVGAKDAKGYGRIGIGSKRDGTNRTMAASRASYIAHNGLFSSELFVLHRCDNPACVNPDHLFLGTAKDNVDDMDRKGRRVNGERRGSKNPRAKLTSEQVAAIALDPRGQREIAREYGVCKSTIGYIKRGKTWAA